MDQVRRQENKSLKKEGDTTLVGTKQMWLFNPENLSFNRLLRFSELKEQALKTGRAWAMEEQFRTFWECLSRVTAVGFFEQWCEWASKSKLTPIVAKAEMLKRHLPGLLNYVAHRLTNATSEGFNSKIQQIKSNARGFRSFQCYRVRIRFACGKLDLLPRKVSH